MFDNVKKEELKEVMLMVKKDIESIIYSAGYRIEDERHRTNELTRLLLQILPKKTLNKKIEISIRSNMTTMTVEDALLYIDP